MSVPFSVALISDDGDPLWRRADLTFSYHVHRAERQALECVPLAFAAQTCQRPDPRPIRAGCVAWHPEFGSLGVVALGEQKQDNARPLSVLERHWLASLRQRLHRGTVKPVCITGDSCLLLH